METDMDEVADWVRQALEIVAKHIEGGGFALPVNIVIVDAAGVALRTLVRPDMSIVRPDCDANPPRVSH
jgi:hypothetical protein